MFIHSDTLKSAIFSVAAVLNPDLQNPRQGESFFNAFLVSSTFPYYNNTLFLPKPKGILNILETPGRENSYEYKKDLKKVNFIDAELYFNFFNEKKDYIPKDDTQFLIASEFIVKPNLLQQLEGGYTRKKPTFSITKSEVQERVYLRKMHEIFDDAEDEKPVFSEPYIVDRIYFRENTGLYFMLDILNDLDINFFEKILKNLGEFGIGTDRNVGNGQFEVIEAYNEVFNFAENAEFLTCVSLFLPTQDEVANFTEKCQYRLIKRGGWISNAIDLEILKKNELKKSVYMIDEASVFENKTGFKGKIVDLSPDGKGVPHPIWRDGRAIFFPINNIKIV